MVVMLRAASPGDDFSIAAHARLFEIRQTHLVHGRPAPRDISDEPVRISTASPMPNIIAILADIFLVSDQFKAALELHAKAADIEWIPMKLIANDLAVVGVQYYFVNVHTSKQFTDWDRTRTRSNGISPKYKKDAYSAISTQPGRYFFPKMSRQNFRFGARIMSNSQIRYI